MYSNNPRSSTLRSWVLVKWYTNWMSILGVQAVKVKAGPSGLMCRGFLSCCNLMIIYLYFFGHFSEMTANTLSVIKVR